MCSGNIRIIVMVAFITMIGTVSKKKTEEMLLLMMMVMMITVMT